MTSYYRDTWIEIKLDHVIENVANLTKHYYQGKRILAVVKANSYGHGAVMVAKALESIGVDFFGVATIDEALELRLNRIKSDILVFGLVRLTDLELASRNNLIISITSVSWLKEAVQKYVGPTVLAHLKVETGLHRLGIRLSDLKEVIGLLNENARFSLEGIYSHLASAPSDDETYYHFQMTSFLTFLKKANSLTQHPIPYVHITNSAASLKQLPKEINLIRLGLMINGVIPRKDLNLPFELKPSLSLYSTLVDVKLLPPGSKIGYNCEYETKSEEWIGTVAIGYADGILPTITRGKVFIEDDYHKIVGRVCMDYCFVKLSKAYSVGTKVEFIGPHIMVDEFAEDNQTHNYHATCMLSDRIPRLYYYNNQLINTTNARIIKYSKEE